MPKKDVYSLTLEMGTNVYTWTGTTALEAIEQITVPMTIGVTKGFLTFEKNGKSKRIMLVPMQIKRLGMKISRLSLIKNFGYGLK